MSKLIKSRSQKKKMNVKTGPLEVREYMEGLQYFVFSVSAHVDKDYHPNVTSKLLFKNADPKIPAPEYPDYPESYFSSQNQQRNIIFPRGRAVIAPTAYHNRASRPPAQPGGCDRNQRGFPWFLNQQLQYWLTYLLVQTLALETCFTSWDWPSEVKVGWPECFYR